VLAEDRLGPGSGRHRVPLLRSRARPALRGRADARLLPALELALVDVAFLGRPELAAGELAFVDRVVELPRREAVADSVQGRENSLEREVEPVVRLLTGDEDDRVDPLERLGGARVQVEDRDPVRLDPA